MQASAAPRLPASDAEVLERLPFKANDPVAREMASLRAALARNPDNVEQAVGLAQRYYSMVAEEGDPRFLGYAEAALRPWWNLPDPPLEVQVLRASLRQFRHDFAGAVTDLSRVIERAPDHAQARALRATIHIVQARYEAARTDCRALRSIGSELIAIGCEAMVDGLTGQAAPAYQQLNVALLRMGSTASPAQRLWVSLRLAEFAQRLGRAADAESQFKLALATGMTDTFLLTAYADFLLDQGRPAEVLTLLKDRSRSDSLLLRLALAERALGQPSAGQREATLAARYLAAQMRGDTAHQQEEARFALIVQGDSKRALVLSLENWRLQLEPRDARIVLESAIAQHDAAAAVPVLAWMDANKVEDTVLAGLAAKLRGASK